jgi:hypothetical protein
MNNKYICTDNYNIIENPNFFDVDEQIAETISILNKKGYRTVYSCAGHNDHSCYKATAFIDLLEKAKEDPNYHVGEIREKDFDYYRDNEISSTYIKFDNHYDFDYLPEGFDYETVNEFKERISNIELVDGDKGIIYGDTIERTIFYMDNNERKSDEIIDKEIADANRILLEWAKKLSKRS